MLRQGLRREPCFDLRTVFLVPGLVQSQIVAGGPTTKAPHQQPG